MMHAQANSRDERNQKSKQRASLSDALQRYRKRRNGYDQMRSGEAPRGLYRPQRSVRHDYRV